MAASPKHKCCYCGTSTNARYSPFLFASSVAPVRQAAVRRIRHGARVDPDVLGEAGAGPRRRCRPEYDASGGRPLCACNLKWVFDVQQTPST